MCSTFDLYTLFIDERTMFLYKIEIKRWTICGGEDSQYKLTLWGLKRNIEIFVIFYRVETLFQSLLALMCHMIFCKIIGITLLISNGVVTLYSAHNYCSHFSILLYYFVFYQQYFMIKNPIKTARELYLFSRNCEHGL